MSKIADFITENWQTMALIYTIGAAVMFIVVLAFFIWVMRAEDKEKELYPEYYEDGLDTASSMLLALITAVSCAVVWVAIPLVLAGAWLYLTITEKFPSIMGEMGKDAEIIDKEESEE